MTQAKETATEHTLPEDKSEAMMMASAAALVYGFNELAKGQETLGAKVYYRLLRDAAEQRFIELGGAKLISGDPPIATIAIPGAPQCIEFRPMDIELMRATVAEYDAKNLPPEPGPLQYASGWPPRDVVSRLVAAAQHLLHDHDCDQHGYEELSISVAVARDWLGRDNAEKRESDAPFVCPGCHAVGPERCAPGCIDEEMRREELFDYDPDRFDRDTDDEEDDDG